MLRHCFLMLGMVAALTVPTGGCRSCSSCHDYDPPVANCDCCACGTQRAGSVSGGGGCGCSSCGCHGGGDVSSEEVYYNDNGEVIHEMGEPQETPPTNRAR